MSPQDLARAFAQAVHRPDALAALLDADADWSLPPSLGTPVQVGREAIVTFRRRLFHDVLDGSTAQVQVLDVVASEDRLALRTRLVAQTTGGLAYDNVHAYFVAHHPGRIRSVSEHLDPAHAMAQLNPVTEANEVARTERVSANHMKVYTSLDVDAPHDVVWAVLTDFAAMPQWSTSFQGLEGDFRDGGHVTAVFHMMGFTQRFEHELRFFEEGAQFGWSDPTGAGFTDLHVYRVEPLLNGRSRVVQTDEPQGPSVRLLGGLVASQTAAAFQAFNRELKSRAEDVHRGV